MEDLCREHVYCHFLYIRELLITGDRCIFEKLAVVCSRDIGTIDLGHFYAVLRTRKCTMVSESRAYETRDGNFAQICSDQ